jgi:hypothetical protein
METTLNHIFNNGQSVQLIGLITAALFFMAIAIKELTHERLEGLLFGAISIFFFVAHFYFLGNLPAGNALLAIIVEAQIWLWITSFLAPALIALFLTFGIWSIITSQRQSALVKLFFGLSLLCYLYMLGPNWPRLSL